MRTIQHLLILCAILWGAPGCKKSETEPPPLWEQVTLDDLEPPDGPGHNGLQPIAGVNIDIHYFEVAVDELKTLLPVWNPLSKQGIRFRNALSFQGNGLQFSRTRLNKFSWILGSLERAKAMKVGVSSLIIAEDYDSDLLITSIPGRHTISFLDMKGNTQSAAVGPGQLNLRFKVDKTEGSPIANQITAYPMVTVPSYKGIEKLDELASRDEAAFLSSSFSARVTPGDVFLLGPEEFFGEISTLGGLFFLNPRGRYFKSPRPNNPPEHKPTVRVYVILCTSVQ